MQKIAINLLPQEIQNKQLTEKRFFKIQAISVSIVLFLAFLASTAVALGVLQSRSIQQAQASVEELEEVVSSLQDKESSLVVLKDRLTTIQKLKEKPSKQRTIYNIVNSLIPATSSVTSFSVDRSGNLILAIIFPDVTNFDAFLNDLISKEKTEGIVTKVTLESLNRSREGNLRTSLTIKTD